jgi:hypothetical protein
MQLFQGVISLEQAYHMSVAQEDHEKYKYIHFSFSTSADMLVILI